MFHLGKSGPGNKTGSQASGLGCEDIGYSVTGLGQGLKLGLHWSGKSVALDRH